MKKLVFFFLFLLAFGLSFESCSNTKSYADMLDDEKAAISAFIKDHDIKVITQSEFYANDSTTDTLKNEYVHLSSGVYMQIVSKGSTDPADTVRKNDKILVRFMEYSIMAADTTLSNLDNPEVVDEFNYTTSGSSLSGIFTQGYMSSVYGSSVPSGWLVPLPYIRSMAHVKLIVPSKMGHSTASQYVYPYFYDIRKYQIYR